MHSECNLRKGALHPAAFGLTAPLRMHAKGAIK
jgi:hypothetical protein